MIAYPIAQGILALTTRYISIRAYTSIQYSTNFSGLFCSVALAFNQPSCFSQSERSIDTGGVVKQEGWLNARAAEQNSPEKFVEYWIAVQARIDTHGVVKAKTPSAIG